MAKPKRKPTRQATRKKEGRKKATLWFGIIMIALMVFSVTSVILYNPESTDYSMEYGEYEFNLEERSDGGSVLVTDVNGQEVEFQNLPPQVQHIEMDARITSLLHEAQQIGLVADPSIAPATAGFVDYARLQISLAIPKTFNAMSMEDERYQLPVLNCSHANEQMPLVLFNLTNETTAISLDGYCITMSAAERDLMRAKDRLIFEYIGVLQDGVVVE